MVAKKQKLFSQENVHTLIISTLATVIGIVVTFGVSWFVSYYEDAVLASKLLLRIDDNISFMSETLDYAEHCAARRDTIYHYVVERYNPNLEVQPISDDTIALFFLSIAYNNYKYHETTTYSLLNDLKTFNSIDNHATINIANEAFVLYDEAQKLITSDNERRLPIARHIYAMDADQLAPKDPQARLRKIMSLPEVYLYNCDCMKNHYLISLFAKNMKNIQASFRQISGITDEDIEEFKKELTLRDED